MGFRESVNPLNRAAGRERTAPGLTSHLAQENQVTPFSLTTADNQTLYAWHILPLPLYAQHEATLSAQPGGFCEDITATENFRLLRDDPNAKLIISCTY